jgi:hypothetical protein
MLVAFLGCGGGNPTHPRQPDDPGAHSQLADEDRFVPTYGKPELQKALIAERGIEATAERMIADLEAKDDQERLRVANADLAVHRRFIAALEECEAHGDWCPPRLDDPPFAFDPDGEKPPPLDTPLRFDLESWRKVSSELHARSCACRTIACVDNVGIAIDQLESRPMPDIQADDAATIAITRARECLFRLRGKSVHARAQRSED